MEVPSRPQGRLELSSRKTGGKPRLRPWLTMVALVAGFASVAHVAFAQTSSAPSSPPVPAAPPAPPAVSSAGASAPHVTLYGEVRRQGRYEIAAGETVGGLIIRAGGFSAKAKDKAVKVIRDVPGKGKIAIVVNVRDVLSGKAPGKDIPLSPSDTVIVEEKLINF